MFENCETLKDLKKEYHAYAKVAHPDHGGTNRAMREVNAAYAAAVKHFSRYGRCETKEAKRTAANDRRETSAKVNAAISAIENLPGLTIELVGLWVWVSGNTYAHKSALYTAGYKWAPKKKLWYFAGIESRGFGAPMDDIRAKYGSETIRGQKAIKG